MKEHDKDNLSFMDWYWGLMGAAFFVMVEPLLIHAITGEWKCWPTLRRIVSDVKYKRNPFKE